MSDNAIAWSIILVYLVGGFSGVATRSYLEAIWLAEKHDEDRLKYPSLYAPGSIYPKDKATMCWPECLVGWFFGWWIMLSAFALVRFGKTFKARGWKAVESRRIAQREEQEIDRIIAEQKL